MMTVQIPPDLAREIGCPGRLTLDDRPDLGSLMADLETRYPVLVRSLLEADRTFRPHLAVFIAGRRLPTASGLSVNLTAGAEIFVLRAVSGG